MATATSAPRRVVIVAPSFAPASNPPTQRVRFFARHLPRFGWEPTVLTVRPEFYEEPPDPDAYRLVPPGLRTVRTGALPAPLTRLIGIGDLGIRSYWAIGRRLRTMCREERPDLLFFPGPPWHQFRWGPVLRREFGVPYVLDYIDPWISALGADGRWWTKAYWFRQVAIALEPPVVRGAAHLVAVSTGTTDGIRRWYPDIPAERCTGIPYGVEPTDFDTLRTYPRPNALWAANDGLINLVAAGAMLPHGYDTLRALFAALATLRAERPTLAKRVRLRFVGTTYEPTPRRELVMPVAREMGVADAVTEHPARVPYLDALNLLCTADGNLALGSSEPHYTASKIFPAIFAQRPLLAVYHARSSVCDVIRSTNAGELVTFDDAHPVSERVAAIAGALTRLVSGPTYNPAGVHWEALASYHAEAVTGTLARIFDACVAANHEAHPCASV